MKRLLATAVLGLALLAGYDAVTRHLDSGSPDVATAQRELAPLRLFETPLDAQEFRGYHKAFIAQTTTGNTVSSGLMRGVALQHTAELIVTGAPATCTYRLQGTGDGVTWFNVSAADVTCTTSTVAFEANKPVMQVRGSLITLTGGTAPTVRLKYIGR
jgi:hypothetical protein